MSQAKLTLRPPPNVDFVQGYPGIPPGPDRPQAAVKGAIEVRVGPGGVKAKWVRIELRKVETLPGGGLANTFFDFVGQSPVSLWQSGDEYSMLPTQDFQFNIRIPESIPPSIALEKGAGIKYELIATLCIKGKKGFLRRDKHVVLSTSAPIIIDKHELHSTWPVYVQPETRNVAGDGISLVVERTNTCYGPGDRIAVMAVVKSESLQTAVLRGFEFALRESIVFRAGPNTVGKKAAPQVKTGNVSEQKVPVNATLYSGMQHKAELAITVPTHHTSTTLNAARHIDITYVLSVKALMATGKPLVMDLPIVISNWPRSVSVEAVRRIGLAPNVSSHTQAQQLLSNTMSVTPSKPSMLGNHPYMHPTPAPAPTTITESSDGPSDLRSPGAFNTAPTNYGRNTVDEFGARVRSSSIEQPGGAQTIGIAPGAGGSAAGVAVPRPGGRGSAPSQNRLTVTNYGEDMPEEVRKQTMAAVAAKARHQRNPSASSRPSMSAPRSGFMNAEEEKRMLYEKAKAQVEQTQGVARTQSPPLEVHSPKPVRDPGPILQAPDEGASSKPSGSAWPTAEQEKARLYNQAQNAVAKTQGLEDGGMSSQRPQDRASPVNQPTRSAGAAMYSRALESIGRRPDTANSAHSATSIPPTKRSYPSAEEEKAAFRRYEEAKAAVDRNHYAAFGSASEQSSVASPSPPMTPPNPPTTDPIPYDALFPSPQPQPRMVSPPPPGAGGSSQPQYMSEKEKLRRHHEAQDAAALAAQQAQQQAAASPPPMAPPPMDAPAYFPPTSPYPNMPSSPAPMNGNAGLSEKEILRRKYAADDAAALASAPPPVTPPRSAPMGGRNLPVPRAQPTPPAGASSSRPLTAAEEKARLAAMYAADTSGASPPPPPARSPVPYSPAPPPHTNGVYHANGTNGAYYANGTNGAGVYRQGSVNSTNTNGASVYRQTSVSSSRYGDIPPPPPLLPKPPREYMEETLQEDVTLSARIRAADTQAANGFVIGVDHTAHSRSNSAGGGSGLELRPFTPFDSSFDVQHKAVPFAVPPPPPLPPKVDANDR